MKTRQPEALRLAEILEGGYSLAWLYERGGYEVSAELRRQHALIAELESRLEAIGAGGVSGPLIGQPQAMPDLSQLTERGAKAWAGVDAQGLREGGADMSKERDDLTAFYAWLHTYESEVGALDDGSARVGFIAGRASLQPPGFTAADMATVSAQGFRDGVASVAIHRAAQKGARGDSFARFAGQHKFLEWNREQGADRPMFAAVEYAVFQKAVGLYLAALASTPAQPVAEPAIADSVLEDAACWHWLAEYLVGTRTDLDDEIVASETVNDLRKLVEAAIKQGEKQ